MSVADRIFASMYDRMTAGPEKAGLRDHRRRLIPRATGRVLEIGGGTGANLLFYGTAVQHVTITEPSEPMAKRLEGRLGRQRFPVELVLAPAEELPFADDSFDTAVSTLVLCTVVDQAQALHELRRVLRHDGRLLFIEHVRAEGDRLARWQDRLNGVNKIVGRGCNCNRRTLDGIRSAGFTTTELQHDELRKAPPFVRPLVVGTAERRAAA
jgi:ubiquinone/menaquinone biosynthesis C-methylase UbiE